MENRKKWLILPIIGGLVVALALGVMAFTPGVAANIGLSPLLEDDDTDEIFPWKGGFGGFHGMKSFGRGGRFGTSFDYDAFIAEELGVSVADLQAARQAAQEAALDQAVVEGVISAEQARLIKAGQALRQYIDHKEILSQALGIDAADLEAAREEGKSLPYLFGEMGLEPEEIQAALQSAYEDAIQQAVDDGVITDTQAEQILSKGLGGRMFGGRGCFRIHGGFPHPGLNIAPDNDV